jgi:hypothetical protein
MKCFFLFQETSASQIPAGRTRAASPATTGRTRSVPFAPATQDTWATPWFLATQESAPRIPTVQTPRLASTTSKSNLIDISTLTFKWT